MAQTIIDKENMREVIAKSPSQFTKGLDLARDIKIQGEFHNVIICGMGGSALPADILISLVPTTIPVYIHRDYNLPPTAHADSLVICISYSGNTEETVSALQETIDKNITSVAITTGGKVEQMAKDHNIALVTIPSGIQPRSATGYLFSALAMILSNCGIISDLSEDIKATAEALEAINSEAEKEGKLLAKKLTKKIPIVYASSNLQAVAKIWKIKFNENSKIPAFYNYFPELNHNEMVGFTDKKNLKDFYVLMIKDRDDHPRITKRMELVAALLKKKGVKNNFLTTKEGSLMLRMFSMLLLGDWTSYYVAINEKTDPTPVVLVEDFKRLMLK